MVCSRASPPIPVTPPCGGLAVEVGRPPQIQENEEPSAKSAKLVLSQEVLLLPLAVRGVHRQVGAQHCSSPAGDRVPEAVSDPVVRFCSRGVLLLSLFQSSPGDRAVCSSVPWGFPQSFAQSGRRATRQREMKDTVHTHRDWNALSIKPVDVETNS